MADVRQPCFRTGRNSVRRTIRRRSVFSRVRNDAQITSCCQVTSSIHVNWQNAATAFGAALQNRKMDRVASPPKQDRHETHSPRFARQVSSDPQTARISPLGIYRKILQSPSGGPLQSQRVSDTWCRQSSAGSRDDASISRLAQYAIQFACVDCSTRSLLTIQSFEFMSPE